MLPKLQSLALYSNDFTTLLADDEEDEVLDEEGGGGGGGGGRGSYGQTIKHESLLCYPSLLRLGLGHNHIHTLATPAVLAATLPSLMSLDLGYNGTHTRVRSERVSLCACVARLWYNGALATYQRPTDTNESNGSIDTSTPPRTSAVLHRLRRPERSSAPASGTKVFHRTLS